MVPHDAQLSLNHLDEPCGADTVVRLEGEPERHNRECERHDREEEVDCIEDLDAQELTLLKDQGLAFGSGVSTWVRSERRAQRVRVW